MYQDSTIKFRQKRVINCNLCPFKTCKKCNEDMCWDYITTRLAACDAILKSLNNAELCRKYIDTQVANTLLPETINPTVETVIAIIET